MTSKQRAYLRGLANTMEPIIHVGKDGVNDNMIKQLSDALEARELIKGKVLETAPESAREAAEALAAATPDQEKSFGIGKVWINGRLVLDGENLDGEAVKTSGYAIGV